MCVVDFVPLSFHYTCRDYYVLLPQRFLLLKLSNEIPIRMLTALLCMLLPPVPRNTTHHWSDYQSCVDVMMHIVNN
jgi:hypothetical protein